MRVSGGRYDALPRSEEASELESAVSPTATADDAELQPILRETSVDQLQLVESVSVKMEGAPRVWSLQEVLDGIGFGRYHWRVVLMTGLYVCHRNEQHDS